MKDDKQFFAKGKIIRKWVFGFAMSAAVVATTVLCSVFIIKANADGKNIDDRNYVSVPDKNSVSIAETEREQEKETQMEQEHTKPSEMLTSEYMLRYDGLDISGSDKKGNVYFREFSGAVGGTSELSIWVDGEMIWTSDSHMAVSTAHVGQTSYYAVEVDGKKYLMEYTPYVGQGMGTPHYEIFSVDKYGNEKIIDEKDVGFILFKKSDGESYFPVDDMLEFSQNVEKHIESGRLLVSTVRGVFDYDNSDAEDNKVYPYLEYIYPWLYENAYLNINEYDSLEQLLIKFQELLPVRSEDWDGNFENMKKELDNTNENK